MPVLSEQSCCLVRSNQRFQIWRLYQGAPDYESGGQEFESLRARHKQIAQFTFFPRVSATASTTLVAGSNMEAATGLTTRCRISVRAVARRKWPPRRSTWCEAVGAGPMQPPGTPQAE